MGESSSLPQEELVANQESSVEQPRVSVSAMLTAGINERSPFLMMNDVQEATSSTREEIKNDFVSRMAALMGSEGPTLQNSFAPVPAAPRTRSVVEVFHAISIPDILSTIAQGSVDYILSFIRRSAPERDVVYTEFENAPIAPIETDTLPALPDGTSRADAEVGTRVAQNVSLGESPLMRAPIVYEERLRDMPAAVFADASPAHQASDYVPTHRPLAAFEKGALPIPERNTSVQITTGETRTDGPVKKVFRVLFPWFFGEVR